MENPLMTPDWSYYTLPFDKPTFESDVFFNVSLTEPKKQFIPVKGHPSS